MNLGMSVTAAPTAALPDVAEAAGPPKKAWSTNRRPRKMQMSKEACPESLRIVIAPRIGAVMHRGPANAAAATVDLPVAIATITSVLHDLIPAGPNPIGVSRAENPLREARVALAMEVAAVTPAAIPTSAMQEALRGIAAMNPAAMNPAAMNPAAKAHAEKNQTAKAHAEKSQTAKAHAEKSQTAMNRHAMSLDAKIRVGGADATRISRGTERSMVPIGIPDPQTAARAMIAATDRADRATAIAIHDRNRRIASLVHA